MSIEVWTWKGLVEAAGGRSQAERVLREKQVWRVMRGAYVGAEHPDGPEVRLAALHQVVPEHAVIGGRTALWALGLPLGGTPDPVEVVVPRGLHLRPRAGVLARAAALPDDDLVQVGGRRVLSPARVVADVLRRDGVVEGVALGDLALRHGLTTPRLIEASLERAAGLRGVVAARSALAHLEPRSESLMESRLRVRLVLAGLRRPDAQVDLYDEARHLGRADLFLDGAVFEYDGFEVHADRRAFVRDRQRQNDMIASGLLVCRFTSEDMHRSDEALLRSAQRTLAAAAGRTGSWHRGRDTLRAPRATPPPTLADRAAA